MKMNSKKFQFSKFDDIQQTWHKKSEKCKYIWNEILQCFTNRWKFNRRNQTKKIQWNYDDKSKKNNDQFKNDAFHIIAKYEKWIKNISTTTIMIMSNNEIISIND